MARRTKGQAAWWCLVAGSLLAAAPLARADYFDDVGISALRDEFGAALPVASDVPVMIVEADRDADPGNVEYAPDPDYPEFEGQILTVGEGGPRVYAPFSAHATGVGRRFFGLRSSVAPGIDRIAVYSTLNWLGPAFLRLGEIRGPKAAVSRVAAHAWVGSADSDITGAANAETLRRVDWLIERDELLHVVGFNGSRSAPLLADAGNVLAVAHTGTDRHRATLAIDADYVAGRTRPHLVAPDKTPSGATGRIASVAAMLIGAGHDDPSLSRGSTKTRTGWRIYNAERAEVIRAVLMSGADRITANGDGANITDYRVAEGDRMDNGLDRRYGAGQLNAQRSYRILTAGEQDSREDGAAGGRIAPIGFDYDASFGGAGGSNAQATYALVTGAGGGVLTATLVWNLEIVGGALFFDPTGVRHDLDLFLDDVSGGRRRAVAASRGSLDNNETLHVTLAPGRRYEIRVRPGDDQRPFDRDYALAWQVTAGAAAVGPAGDPGPSPHGPVRPGS